MAIFKFEHQWEVFKLMAVEELKKSGYNKNPWDLAFCLDMSFEEDYLNTGIETCRDLMVADIEEMKKDCQGDFL
mgnify:CR=1 FL=1